MAVAPDTVEIFDRAVSEGQRRLGQSLLELVSTGFIAGFTIVFGIVALGIVEALVEPQFGEVARLAGALAFGVGIVFLVVGRAELFTENFFDPAAAAVDSEDSWRLRAIGRLWGLTIVFNLVGGALFALVFAVEGTVPPGTAEALAAFAEKAVQRSAAAWFASAIAGGALVTLMSYLLVAVDSIGSRMAIAYVVVVLLALGPFDHVIVTVLHVLLGLLYGAPIGWGRLLAMGGVVAAGNLVGGLGLVTLTHVTQAMGARESGS
jgi:formate/nitrite transporter FocA (FNT family)